MDINMLEFSKMNNTHANLIIDWIFDSYFYDNKVCEADISKLLQVVPQTLINSHTPS